MKPRYKLRTLLLLLAILPPVVAVVAPPLYQWAARKPPPVAIPANPKGQPTFVVYSIGSADPTLSYMAISTLLAGTPGLRMSLDSETGSLSVFATPDVHKIIAVVIAELQNGAIKSEQSPATKNQ